MSRLTGILIALSIGLAAPAYAITHVDADASGANDGSSWADAFTDLQAALAATPAGEIWIAEGVYRPAAPGGARSASFALKNGVALYGGFAGTESSRVTRNTSANPTVLSGDLNGDDMPRLVNGHASFFNAADNSHHVVTAIDVDDTARLDGVTLAHGYAYAVGFEGPSVGAGGGMLVMNASPTLRRLTLTGNAGPRGGAVAIFGSTASFINSAFVENYADIGSGGAVYSDGLSDSTFHRCTFRANAAIGGQPVDGMGGAIYNAVGGRLTVTSSDFFFNYTGFRTYSLSEERTRGGAIASWGTQTTIRESRFIGNRSHLGGALYAHDPSVLNSVFNGNEATDARTVGLSPAGLGGAIVALGQSEVLNTTVAANTSSDNGAGLYTSGDVLVANSIVWGNRITGFIEPGEDPVPLVKVQIHKGAGTLEIRYSDVEGLFDPIPGEDPPNPASFPGSIDTDPLFADAAGPDGWEGTEDDDLRLAAGSPAIDAGENASVPAGTDVDLAGHHRYADDPATPDSGAGSPPIVDMGAYEFGSTAPQSACGLGFELAFLLPILRARRRKARRERRTSE